MPIKNSSNLHMPDAKQAFLEDAGELWDKNSDRILNLVNGAEEGKARVAFSVVIDVSENEPLVSVEIGGGQRFKDKRQRTLQNPAQLPLINRDNKPAMIDVSRNGENGKHDDGNGTVVSFDQAKAEAKEAQSKRGRKKAKAETTEESAEVAE